MVSAGKDMMAAYVRQLLEQDESRRIATLENLSKYNLKEMDALAAARGAQAKMRQEARLQPAKVAVSSTLLQASRQKVAATELEPAMIDLPPGLRTPMQGMEARQPMARAPAEVASCISLSRVTTPPVAQYFQEPFPDGSKCMPSQMGSQMGRPEPQPTMPMPQLVKMLEKALVDLSSSLPREAASEVQRVLSALVDQAHLPKGQTSQDTEAREILKWLPKLLAKQQEASINKLVKLMGANVANVGQFPSGVVPGQPLPPPGITATGTAALQRPLAWGRVDTNMAMQQQGCMPESSYMPPMRGGLPQWWGAAAQAQQMAMQAAQAPVSPNHAVQSPAAAKRQTAVAARGQKPEVPRAPRRNLDSGDARRQMSAMDGNMNDGGSAQNGETLRMHLRSLIKIDSARILIVRKINRLGFASPDLLKNHFSWYGNVETVLVAHSRVKSSALSVGTGKNTSRLRPSGLGFLVMSKAEEAEAILAAGPEQLVYGAVIRVQHFERRTTDEEGIDLDNDNDEDLMPNASFAEDQRSV